jgi:putative peptidoglycan lipid II flippase
MIDVKKIIQATTILTAITLVVKGLGFVEKLLLAYFFGTGAQVDAYLVVYTIPFAAYIVLSEVVRPAFLPIFMRVRRQSEEGAWRLFSATGTVLFLLLVAATIAGILWAEPLISLAAPGFSGEQRVLAVRLTRLVMPALLFLGLSTLTTSALNAEKRFTLPALGDVSYRLGPLLLLVATRGIAGMTLGASLGALGKLLIELLGLHKCLRRIRPTLNLASEPVRTVGRLAAPLLAAMFLSLFVAPLVENAFATKIGVGGVSALAYARKIAETLTSILPYTLGLVLLPFSAEVAARQDDEGLARLLTGTLRWVILLFLPVAVGLAALREPFVRFVFERGAFTSTSTELTVGPLLFYAFALLPFSLEVIAVPFFFARQDTLTPVLTDIAAFVLNVALIPPLMVTFGLGGIALAAAVSKALKVLLLLVLFGRQVPAFHVRSFGPFVGQMVLAALATTAMLLVVLTLGRSFAYAQDQVALVGYLVAGGLLGGGTFFLVAYLLKVPELHDLWRRGRAWGMARIRDQRG